MSSVAVKICGITRVVDARLAVDLGACYLGLNFWPRSPRFVTSETALEIAAAVRGEVQLVGVWVAPERAAVEATVEAVGLDLLQFHDATDPRAPGWFPHRVIQALRPIGDFDHAVLEQYGEVWGFLFDPAPAGVHGGSGRSWAYERIANLATTKPVLLAGGLGPGNVADAVRRSRARIVDVCSGVEAAPGVKDARLMEKFFLEVQNAQSS